ncbi:MAG: molecular chaperone HtpG [Clostridia bacterium]|nr:molecular chaperone HtpG [Clostridia bacterium]
MNEERGNVSVTTENIFPIIRKWLYSDRDIFLRELVSNAADACAKLQRLAAIGEIELPEDEELKIEVVFDRKAKTLIVQDNGIGMTADEVKKYINQIAFSSVMDFVEKYKDKGVESEGIIGHFGLGFYSAFMVSDKVRIDTLSFQPGAEAVSWESEDGLSYVLGPSDYQTRGTRVTLTLSDEGMELLSGQKVREILDKYCSFMPIPIYFIDVEAEEERKKQTEEEKKRRAEEKAKKAEEAAKKGEILPEEEEEDISIKPQPINDVSPLWLKKPSECTDEEYKEFYHKTFHDYRDPLFWIHLNMDYPFNLKGILYFPPMDNIYESLDGRIKIYYNQVFVADNVKEIIPEFLFLLKGVLDCPDLPLNVSRSFLQNDAYVNKLSSHIVRKVADKLNQLFKNQREDYEKYWKDISVFIKYGMMQDEKFYDRVKDIVLFKTVDHTYKTLNELGDTILYTPDPNQQIAYVQMAKARGLTVVIMDHEIDNHFMSFLEFKNPGKRFKRVDAELGGEDTESIHQERLTELFRKVSGDDQLKVKVQSLGEQALPAMLVESEESRRMQEMRKQFERMGGQNNIDFDAMFPIEITLIINDDHPLISRLSALADLSGKEETARIMAQQIYDLARLGHGSLTADDMAAFLKRSTDVLDLLTAPSDSSQS